MAICFAIAISMLLTLSAYSNDGFFPPCRVYFSECCSQLNNTVQFTVSEFFPIDKGEGIKKLCDKYCCGDYMKADYAVSLFLFLCLIAETYLIIYMYNHSDKEGRLKAAFCVIIFTKFVAIAQCIMELKHITFTDIFCIIFNGVLIVYLCFRTFTNRCTIVEDLILLEE